jgi:hypothetical protein
MRRSSITIVLVLVFSASVGYVAGVGGGGGGGGGAPPPPPTTFIHRAALERRQP